MGRSAKEGDLYKSINVFGRVFTLYYGYYEEKDKYSKFSEPIPIYPNFIEYPMFTDEGYPFATEMQDICGYYNGAEDGESCYRCLHFHKGNELIGICRCTQRRQTT